MHKEDGNILCMWRMARWEDILHMKNGKMGRYFSYEEWQDGKIMCIRKKGINCANGKWEDIVHKENGKMERYFAYEEW